MYHIRASVAQGDVDSEPLDTVLVSGVSNGTLQLDLLVDPGDVTGIEGLDVKPPSRHDQLSGLE